MRTLLFFIVALTSCSSSTPTAMGVCKQLESAGVAAACKADTPSGLTAGASEKAAFDLVGVPGKTGQVLRFDKDETYASTVAAFEKAALLAGPHRYGSSKARILVQMNEAASADLGGKAKAIVDKL